MDFEGLYKTSEAEPDSLSCGCGTPALAGRILIGSDSLIRLIKLCEVLLLFTMFPGNSYKFSTKIKTYIVLFN